MTTRSVTLSRDTERRLQAMTEWNECHKKLRGAFLPKNVAEMENTTGYKKFLEDYGVMPFQVESETAGKLRMELVEGFRRGKTKYGVDEGTLVINHMKYHGYNMYPNHKGSPEEAEARNNQKWATTSILGRDLRNIRKSLDALYVITTEVENLTGLVIAKMDILRQSETGKGGKKEVIFTYHRDTTEVSKAIATATILLTNTESSMQVLGYRPILYHGVGSGCLFASDLYHQTVRASEGTMKITFFLVRDLCDPIVYTYELKDAEGAVVKWNLATKFLKYLRQNEDEEYRSREYFGAVQPKKKMQIDLRSFLGEQEMKVNSDEYMQECWNKVKSNEVLRVHFLNWFQMTTQLVGLTTARGKKDPDGKKEEQEEISDWDYGEDEDGDSDLETQEGLLGKSGKRNSAEGDKSAAALASIRTKRRRRSIAKFGKGDWAKKGWELDVTDYLNRKENHSLNLWLNNSVHGDMMKTLFSHKDMMKHFTADSEFGNKLISTVAAIKMKYSLDKQDVFGVSYFVAQPGAARSQYVPRMENCENVILHSFTDLDVILLLDGEEHFVKVASKTALVFKAEIQLYKSKNETKNNHRYVIVELAKKGSVQEV